MFSGDTIHDDSTAVLAADEAGVRLDATDDVAAFDDNIARC